MKTLLIPAKAIGLAFLLCVTLIPGLAPGAPKPKADNIVYVDNVNGDDANPGTAAQPKATIQAGAEAAEALYGNDGTVVVWGGGPAYEGGAYVTSSMKYYGNGRGLHGVHAPGNQPAPVVGGSFYANDSESFVIKGFEIIAGNDAIAIIAQNVGNVDITDNYIHDIPYYGIIVSIWQAPACTAHVEDNRFENVGGGGNCVYAQCLETSKLSLVALNNSIATSPGANGFTLTCDGSSEITAIVKRNVIEGANAGCWTTAYGDSQLRLELKDNRVVAPMSVGVRLETAGNAYQSAEVSSNFIEPGGSGGLSVYSYNDSTFDLVASGNVVKDDPIYGGGGTGVAAFDDSTMNAIFDRNESFLGASAGSVDGDTAVLNLTATNNECAGLAGILVYGYFDSVINATVSKNHISDVIGDGIILSSSYGPATFTASLDGNVINGASGDGIRVDFENPANSVTGTKNNVVHDVGGKSLEVVNEPVPGQIKLNDAIISPLVDTP